MAHWSQIGGRGPNPISSTMAVALNDGTIRALFEEIADPSGDEFWEIRVSRQRHHPIFGVQFVGRILSLLTHSDPDFRLLILDGIEALCRRATLPHQDLPRPWSEWILLPCFSEHLTAAMLGQDEEVGMGVALLVSELAVDGLGTSLPRAEFFLRGWFQVFFRLVDQSSDLFQIETLLRRMAILVRGGVRIYDEEGFFGDPLHEATLERVYRPFFQRISPPQHVVWRNSDTAESVLLVVAAFLASPRAVRCASEFDLVRRFEPDSQ
ncbi:Hypothetical predicted protein [Paramuricea clavata]|uniref:Uncharacterized protein n=1 Tax=Paramuricea clavata TaxID=317549 RepID=A0A7D9JD07_PARCT|nr:Hypothetical predicted protein [Paramuricea clavata]